MRKIILDTNFLLIPIQFKVDIFSEIDRICSFNYKLCIFEQTIAELNNIIENQQGKDKKAAQFALKIIKSKKIELIKSEAKDVDCLIFKYPDKDAIIATLDLPLKRKLLDKRISVIFLRQKKYLQLIDRSY